MAAKEQQLQSITRIIDTGNLKQSFKEIDAALFGIDKALTARGLGALKIKNTGGA